MKKSKKSSKKKENKLAIKDNQDPIIYSKDSSVQQEMTSKEITYKSSKINQPLSSPSNNAIQMQPMQSAQPLDPNAPQVGIVDVAVAQNQLDPEALIPNFRSSPIKTMCPYCNTQIKTYVETHLNCLNLCCYCWTSCIVWTIFQLCRGKDLSCSDARHFCPKCGKTLGYYEAC
ncbi:MAG: LITAF-like zinc ribbon domain-containing protein [archaeon]|nr:LITAF-like zinc ribbon domain-containing protein [archaeon]